MQCPHCHEQLTAAVLAALPKSADSNKDVQEAAMLDHLRKAGTKGLTTDDFRAAGFYQVSARIWGLRQMGAQIQTELYDGIGADNVYHPRMARYRLISEPLLPVQSLPKRARKATQKPAEATNGEEAACTTS